MTLSHRLLNYVYYPLGCGLPQRDPNRYSPANLALPPQTTMCLSGLWHGYSWNLLVWGGLHGLYPVLNHLIAPWRGSAARARWTR